MGELQVIKGGEGHTVRDESSASELDQVAEHQFGMPPSLLVGFLTSLIGAGAGIVSLLIHFTLFQPESYISPKWLVFVLAGAVAGYFLRVEQPFVQAIQRDPN